MFDDSEPTVLVRVRGADVAMVVLPGLEVPRPDGYDGYWAEPLHDGTDPASPDSAVREEGEFLVASWRNDPDAGGALEDFVRLHKGRRDRGEAA